jgi:hypothetical protein
MCAHACTHSSREDRRGDGLRVRQKPFAIESDACILSPPACVLSPLARPDQHVSAMRSGRCPCCCQLAGSAAAAVAADDAVAAAAAGLLVMQRRCSSVRAERGPIQEHQR